MTAMMHMNSAQLRAYIFGQKGKKPRKQLAYELGLCEWTIKGIWERGPLLRHHYVKSQPPKPRKLPVPDHLAADYRTFMKSKYRKAEALKALGVTQ